MSVPSTGSQSQPNPGSRLLCPQCGSRLFGACNVGAVATIVWLCRRATCRFYRGRLSVRTRTCHQCSRILLPGVDLTTTDAYGRTRGLCIFCHARNNDERQDP